jgi:hypothetical protein
MPDLMKLLALFAVLAAALWLLRFVLARLTGALVPRLVESREVIGETLMAESPLYARVTRSPWFLVALGAGAIVLVWQANQLRRGLPGLLFFGVLIIAERVASPRLARGLRVAAFVLLIGVIVVELLLR